MRYIYDSQTKSKIPTAGMMNPNIIAPLEPTTVSKRSYLVGDQLIWNDELYTVTRAISVNDTLAVGTNITASDSIVEQIAENTSDISSLNEALAKQTLYFTSVACAATTGNFATVSNANISADHVVVKCTFANPSAITTDVRWTTANGSLTLNGTCASATTANITLSKKGN